jgi:hypothetical protein
LIVGERAAGPELDVFTLVRKEKFVSLAEGVTSVANAAF